MAGDVSRGPAVDQEIAPNSGGHITDGSGNRGYVKRLCLLWSVLALLVLLGRSAATAFLQRTLNGPAAVVPGHVYTFTLSGFTPGEEVYPTVQPASCARTSERCEEAPCSIAGSPHCSLWRIGPSGTANVRFRWPELSAYVVANMAIAHHRWRRGSRALVRIDLASRRVPRGCQKMASLTANPQAGSTVCSATLTTIN